MSSPSNNLAAPSQKRPPSLRRGALKIAAIYLVFATLWIIFFADIFSSLVDPHRILYLETLEDSLFALCTGILLYVLVLRFARERTAVEDALRQNERRYRSLVL